ncbi:SOS response-associated peptidase [Rufibacter latericius]|uniref:Abasic site processing protein n=1 Tax=Rufibacter latericius TaxID=2487040 RepID=A0A3M9MB01_9BACT|nr:SOS response-associated peptidase [Rufibacter latericius]RNI22694.1 SOS response-associated peptidase [Rufibacter latericius]
MCGRYSVIPKKKGKATQHSSVVSEILDKYQQEPRFNAAPSQLLPVVTNQNPNEVQFFSWGLLPSWAKEKEHGLRPINARTETILEKSTFKRLLAHKRCLVPADGFYEWKKVGKDKTPYRILMKEGQLFTFAGLWDEWVDPSTGEVLHTFTVITTEPNELMAGIHNRMPVILHPEEEHLWLSESEDVNRLAELLRPYPAEEMTAYPVSALVNSPKNDVPSVLEPVSEQGSLFS